VNTAGYGNGGPLQKRCARVNCRGIALRGSLYCRHHDFAWKRKRLAELRAGKGRLRATPTELTRIFRADTKSMWSRAPWHPAMTIWLAPKLEATFTEDCRRAGLLPSRTAPVCLDTLRWAWRRSVLNYRDDPGWQRAVNAARKRMARIGEPPEDYSYTPPSDTPPGNPCIRAVFWRLNAMELAKTRPPVDRTTKAKARRHRLAPVRTPSGFDWQQFFQQHWLDVFRSIWRTHHLDDADVDGELGRRMAIAYRDLLDEQDAGSGAVGPASGRWHSLLRQLADGFRPGPNPRSSRPPSQEPLSAPVPATRLAGAPDNDAWLRGLFDRVTERYEPG
jgi:hypothetical protein